MRYFEIVEPPARQVLAHADAIEAAPAEPRESGIRKPLKANRPALVSNSLDQINRQPRRQHLSTRRSQ